MKTKIITAITLLFSVTSCTSFLDERPQSDLTVDTFWKTETDADVGVLAIYNAFSKAMSPGLWYWGEVRADNFTYNERDGQDERELMENNITYENPAAVWTKLYDVIGKANAAIKYIPQIDMLYTTRDHLLAEAYTLRAWAYFYCIRVWGDVPLYLEPVEKFDSSSIFRKRTSKDYILEEVILRDLEEAYYLIDATVVSGRKRINVATICALLMDVYAWNHDYDMVVKTMEERVQNLDNRHESGSEKWLELSPGGDAFITWRSMFIESSTGEIPNEVWFKLGYERYGNGVHTAVRFFTGSTAKLVPSENLLTACYNPSDIRTQAQWIYRADGDPRFNLKFWPDGSVFTGSNATYSDNDLVMCRYSDVVLLYAEALCMLGRQTDAVVELNRTHMRAGNPQYTIASFASKDELLDAILLERRRELVGEGKRWFDLVRTGRWKEHSKVTEERDLLFPIHRDHLIANPNLIQNDGYPMP